MRSPLRVLRAAALPILAVAIVHGGPAHGDSPLPPALIPPVVVSASRLTDHGAGATRDVIVLDEAAIARLGAASVADLLATVAGVDARTRGPFGTQVDLEMDGATYSQVLVLVDGMRVNDPQTDHHTLNIPLAAADLARVEILRGSASSVHGADAVGGVINLVPRFSTAPRLDVAARRIEDIDGGDARTGTDVNLRFGVGDEVTGLTLSGGRLRSDGYRETTDAAEERLFLTGHTAVAGGRLSLQGGWQDKEFGARDFYAPYPSREWTEALMGSTRFDTDVDGTGVSARVFARRHTDRFVLVESDPSIYENNHTSWLQGGELHARRDVGAGQAVVGGEWTREEIDSSNLGQHVRTRWGGFAEVGQQVGAWRVNAGLRADHGDGGWQAAPSLGVGRPLGAAARWHASLARSYRAPSFTELYYSDPANVGNADLDSESAWQAESGVAAIVGGARVSGALFVRLEEDLVDYVRATDTPPWAARNLGEMQTLGVRLSAARALGPVDASVGYTFVDKEQTLDDGLESKYVFSHPRHQGVVQVHHALPGDLTVDWQVIARERIAPLDDYARVDVVVRRVLDLSGVRAEVRLRANNLLDSKYEEILDVPLPGRWLGAELSVGL